MKVTIAAYFESIFGRAFEVLVTQSRWYLLHFITTLQGLSCD